MTAKHRDRRYGGRPEDSQSTRAADAAPAAGAADPDSETRDDGTRVPGARETDRGDIDGGEDDSRAETASPGAPAWDAADGPSAFEAYPGPEGEAARYLDQLQRLKAEFDNYRKRILREREDWSLNARADVIRHLIPVLDDLRRAREHSRSQGEEAPDAAGLLMILKRFEDIVGQLGLEEQKAGPGEEFDPEQHEAVMALASEERAAGEIVMAVEPGYVLHGKLLRPSKVAVSSGPPVE